MSDQNESVPDLIGKSQLPKLSNFLRFGRNIGIGLIVVFLLFAFVSKSPEERAISSVQQIVESDYLVAPATAKWIEKKLLKHEGRWVHVYFLVDAQNEFGALIRNRLCVVAAIDPDGMIRWNKIDFVQKDCIPESDDLLSLHRNLNHWGEPFTPKDKSISPKQPENIPSWLKPPTAKQ